MSVLLAIALLAAGPAEPSVKALVAEARQQVARQDVAGAHRNLARALASAPNSEDVLAAYAQVSLAARLPVPALVALEPLTRMFPGDATYQYLKGVALLQAGDSPAASEALELARRADPDRPLTLLALGLALNARKLYAEAHPALLRSLELEPDNVEVMAALAETEEGLGDLALARAHAERVLARSASSATAHLVMGMVHMKEQRHAEARDAFLRAVAADPGTAKGHYQLSLAYSRLGDEASAARHLELYQRSRQETEERMKQIRNQTGIDSAGGMRP